MSNSEWANRIQGETKAVATKAGEIYTSSDLEMIETFRDEAIAELAIAMGRTYFAISTMKSALNAGKVTRASNAIRVAKSDVVYRGWKEGMSDDE